MVKLPFILLSFALAATFWLSAAQAAPLECRWAATPPQIDGEGGDAVWQQASFVENFSQPWLKEAPAIKEGTRVKLLWDREWLYFYAEMKDADVCADVFTHNGRLWENDVVELFFRPSKKHAGYFEFEVNPAGAVFDAFFPKAGSWRDPEQVGRGEFHVEAKVAINGTLNRHGDTDIGWTVEGRIPWSDFNPAGGRPVPGEIWQMNLARVNGAAPNSELSSTAMLKEPSFHRTDEFTPIRFVGPEPLTRIRWENERLVGTPDGPPKYSVQRAWPQLAARSLVALASAPGGEWTWFIEQETNWDGPMKLRRFRTAGDGSDAETLLELGDWTYNILFHPNFSENGYLFFGANGPESKSSRATRVLRYRVRDGRPDPASRTVIIEWSSNGHNGGGIAFDSNGLLFVTSGDGSVDSDADQVGQQAAGLRSKILRIDVDHPANGKLYSIPRDNPFFNDNRFPPETWAYGLRNPWHLTFDAISGQLWEGENGQDLWEYARLVRPGENYGWSRFEGSYPFRPELAPGPHPVTFPTIEHSHSEFRSLTGGVVYRGKQFPELAGAYIYGDFNTGRLWAAKHDGTRLEWDRELCDTPLAITHVAADAQGEVILADYGTGNGGGIYKLAAAKAVDPSPIFPDKLSETGLFSEASSLTPAAGVLSYQINAPAWHDGASAEYHLAMPGDGTIEMRPSKSWQAPDQTVLAQTLTNAGRRVETRILLKQQNDWAGYSYIWNREQTDAVLAQKAGADIELPDGQPWRIPSRAECMMCHSRQANFALTLHDAQLNRADQLTKWERLGLLRVDPVGFGHERPLEDARPVGVEPNQRGSALSPLLPCDPSHLARFNAVNDPHASLEKRARSYLGVNCAHCHTLYGGGNSVMDFDWLVAPKAMHALNQLPQHGGFGLPDPRVIAPGSAARSVMISRVSTRGPGQMPPLGTRAGDPDGVRLLVEWIESLPK
ncbi:MAG: hypothetical protein JWL59_3188 [Chthoniobacteraceae bacterium]|nr:hypothetical protein [Chthoniobacteraceae bacterium]